MYVILWVTVVSKVDVVPHTEVRYNAEAEYEITAKCRSPPIGHPEHHWPPFKIRKEVGSPISPLIEGC